MSTEEKITTNEWAAAYTGMPAGTWRGYVTRGLAPKPDGYTVENGRVVAYWNRHTLDDWISHWRPRKLGRPRRDRSADPITPSGPSR